MAGVDITVPLKNLFGKNGHRIVFWDDPDKEFKDALPEIQIPDVVIVDTREESTLELKVRIEIEQPDQKFLLYSQGESSASDTDQLLALRLYSHPFRADTASMTVSKLGLKDQHLRAHIQLRRKFFSAQRLQKLKCLVSPDDNAECLDLKMLAVIAGTRQPDIFRITLALLHALAADIPPAHDAVHETKQWKTIKRVGLDDFFWSVVSHHFAYEDDQPQLSRLVTNMFVSSFRYHTTAEMPFSWRGHELTTDEGERNARVLLTQWKDSTTYAASYNWWAGRISDQLCLSDVLSSCDWEELVESTTFEEIDTRIVEGMVKQLLTEAGMQADRIRSISVQRIAGHWIRSTSIDKRRRKGRTALYEGLSAAAEFLELHKKYHQGFHRYSGPELYGLYESELFRVDQTYRHVCLHASVAAEHDMPQINPLRNRIESHYDARFLQDLSQAWGKHVSDALPETWRIGKTPNQYEFYGATVAPRVSSKTRYCPVIIVSDGLRYELAEEVAQLLNKHKRVEANLTSQLGVLPSHTALGMASLLPHEVISYDSKGNVRVDGRTSGGIENRKKILERFGGIAIKSEDFQKLETSQGRKLLTSHSFVYVYHDLIDATGEKPQLVPRLFKHCQEAILELEALAKRALTSLNATSVIITADHGFLFSESGLKSYHHTDLAVDSDCIVDAKNRYLTGYDLSDDPVAWRGQLKVTARAKTELQFLIPKGSNLFKSYGSKAFIHGGAMLQEIVVPVIKIRKKEDKKASEPVSAQIMAPEIIRITASRYRLSLHQTMPVDEMRHEATLRIAIYDGNNPVTDVQMVTLASTAPEPRDRYKDVTLTLRDGDYDKRKSYMLKVETVGTVRCTTWPVVIDRLISDDF